MVFGMLDTLNALKKNKTKPNPDVFIYKRCIGMAPQDKPSLSAQFQNDVRKKNTMQEIRLSLLP